MVRSLLAGAVAAALLVPATASGAAPDRGLQRAVDGLVARADGPPSAVVVVRRGTVRRTYRAGYADRRTKRRPTADDRTRLASTSKAFSGAVVLKLVAEGRLRLADPIRRWIPAVPAAWAAVTVGEALHHTSGLPDYSQSAPFAALLQADPLRRFDPATLWTYVQDQPLLFPAGSRYRYSNTDNVVAALAAQAAAGTPYATLLRRLVYGPAGLRRTSLPQTATLRAPFQHGYQLQSGAAPEDVSQALNPSGAWASGGMVSTPSDMERFVTADVGARLFPRAVQRRQLRWVAGTSEPPGPGRNAAGLAIFRYRTRCGTVYGHTGNFPGYTQFLAATLDGRRAVTTSVSTVLTPQADAAGWRALRRVEERAVCSAFGKR